ncbi:LacI family transcriptional regulator [Anoxybacter fermentans]|uniref:LacI family transcriptional regulator n=1 Tax=Anoxybacter fermentans TaxID=1323375 RepID=A0A3Q9HR56_9FIRM|nr:LacI family DNA-binding transcriptional regulator [Anoxybacter fermentans]AZR73753.1 LacI family transcriptional regulator [Anoxybacter fermentans]
MSVTIKDIAKEANVSTTTVSRVLNNKPDVSDKTKKKVLEVINKLGYNPNGIARGLVLQKTYTIGLIIPDICNPFFPEVARGIQDKARQLGYSVIFYNTDNNKQREKEAIDLLKSKQVDGIILSLSMSNKEELDKLEEENFPVVQIDRKIPGSIFPTVTIDNILSAYNATKYLIELGHKYLAHITGNLGTKTGQDRLEGFKQALKEFNLDYKDEYILEGDYSKESGYKQMKTLLTQKKRPTAVFAANDLMAIGAYEAIFDYGLKIPEDISIIGHDDIDIASIIRPGLTTMTQPKYKLGQIAAEMLIKRIEGLESDNQQEVVLNTELIVRDSTGGWNDEE